MHVRTDPDGRIDAQSAAPRDGLTEIDDAALVPPEHEPWQRPVVYLRDGLVAWETTDAPADDPAWQAHRLDTLETEVEGIKGRARAVEVTGDDAIKVRDAVAGPAV